ncbi:MAG: hypothetical protein NVV82_11120 [Sporocytophaga sp.]|nr:hypothetical protein [Sporocytophaga sp.]
MQEQEISFQDLAHKTAIDKDNLVKLTSTGFNIIRITLLKISRGLNASIAVFSTLNVGQKIRGKGNELGSFLISLKLKIFRLEVKE